MTDTEGGLEAPLLPARVDISEEPGASSASGEALRLAKLGWPIVVEEVVAYGSTIISVGMAGHLGAFPLSAFGLARSVTNITGIAYLVGVTGGIDTFCSQSHGAREHRLVGVVLQRGILVTLAFCLPVLLLYTQAEGMLRALGQEPALATAAARYIRLYSPVVPCHGIVLCLYRYLIAQGGVFYVMFAASVFFAVTAPINWLLIYKLGIGLDGSALAAVACDVVYLLTLVACATHHSRSQPPAQRPWQGWSSEALAHWGPYVKVVLASIVFVGLDFWVYDIASMLAGMLPRPEVTLAAMSISYNINTLAFMVPFGLSFAVGARVGACLGGGYHKAAKLTVEVGTAMGVAVMAVAGAALLAAGGAAARPFTGDPDVRAEAATIMPPLALAVVANAGTAVLAGALRGCGRQKLGALANLVVNWVLGLPLICLLAFRLRLGAAGLWWGLCASSYLQILVLALLVARFNWGNESQRAGRLVRRLSQARRVAAAAAVGEAASA